MKPISNHRRKAVRLFSTILAVASLVVCGALAEQGGWLKHVPDANRQRTNPFAGQADAVAAGRRIFEDHCAKCHGDDGLGRHKKPSLRSDRVQHATDGELFWLLKNGSLGKGMPTWASLPEPMRWQVIAYVKSLGTAGLFSSHWRLPDELSAAASSPHRTE